MVSCLLPNSSYLPSRPCNSTFAKEACRWPGVNWLCSYSHQTSPLRTTANLLRLPCQLVWRGGTVRPPLCGWDRWPFPIVGNTRRSWHPLCRIPSRTTDVGSDIFEPSVRSHHIFDMPPAVLWYGLFLVASVWFLAASTRYCLTVSVAVGVVSIDLLVVLRLTAPVGLGEVVTIGN